MNSLDVAQKQLNHQWDFPKGIDKKVITYQTDYPLDEDMVSSLKNLESSEQLLDHKWKVTEVFKGWEYLASIRPSKKLINII